MTIKKQGQFIITVGYWVLILALVFVVFKYLIPLIMPFFLAFIFAALLRPVIKFLNRKLHIHYNIAGIFCILLFYIIIGSLIVAFGAKIVSETADLVKTLPYFYENSVEPGLNSLFSKMEEFASTISPELTAALSAATDSLLSSAGSFFTSISSTLLSALSGIALKLPRILLSSVICIIASIFLTLDFDKFLNFILLQLPERAQVFARSAKSATVSTIFRYIRSYLLIMLITFVELSIGLFIIGVNNPFVMAVVIAIVDIFPVVGSGLFLWPWTALLFIQGRIGMAIGMIILYIVITCVRQIMEPKIVGEHVGLPPVITLMCMFVGSSLFGGLGLFGLPILAAVIRDLEAGGVTHIFKKPSDFEKKDEKSQPSETNNSIKPQQNNDAKLDKPQSDLKEE